MAVGNNVQWECLWRDSVSRDNSKTSVIGDVEHPTDKLMETYKQDDFVHSNENEENDPESSPLEYASDASEHDLLIPKNEGANVINEKTCDLNQGRDDLSNEPIPWHNEAWLHAQCYLLSLMATDDHVTMSTETGGGENPRCADKKTRLANTSPRCHLNGSLQDTSTAGAGRAMEAVRSAGEICYVMPEPRPLSPAQLVQGRVRVQPLLLEIPPLKATPDDIISIEQDLEYIKSVLGNTHFMDDSDASYLSEENSDAYEQPKMADAAKMGHFGRHCEMSGKPWQVDELETIATEEHFGKTNSTGGQSDVHVTANKQHDSMAEECGHGDVEVDDHGNMLVAKCSSATSATAVSNELTANDSAVTDVGSGAVHIYRCCDQEEELDCAGLSQVICEPDNNKSNNNNNDGDDNNSNNNNGRDNDNNNNNNGRDDDNTGLISNGHNDSENNSAHYNNSGNKNCENNNSGKNNDKSESNNSESIDSGVSNSGHYSTEYNCDKNESNNSENKKSGNSSDNKPTSNKSGYNKSGNKKSGDSSDNSAPNKSGDSSDNSAPNKSGDSSDNSAPNKSGDSSDNSAPNKNEYHKSEYNKSGNSSNITSSNSENNKSEFNSDKSGNSSDISASSNSENNKSGNNKGGFNQSGNKNNTESSDSDSRGCSESLDASSSGTYSGVIKRYDRRNNNNSRRINFRSNINKQPNGKRKNINNNVSAKNYAQWKTFKGATEKPKPKIASKKHSHPSELDETLTNGEDIWWMRKPILVTYYYPNSREHFMKFSCVTLRYILYVVLVMICVSAHIGTIYIGSDFSTALAKKWLYYSSLGVAVQLLILEPTKVVLIAGFYAFVQKQLL